MKEFEFLKVDPRFDMKGPEITLLVPYVFKEKSEYFDERGTIWIPTSAKGTLAWDYEIHQKTPNHYVRIKNIETLPIWFQELVSQSEKTLEKRDKIRKIFVKEV